jgi:hypothetical protein
MDEGLIITVPDLTRPELADLQAELTHHLIDPSMPGLDSKRLGALDVATVFILLTVASAPTFALFLLKNRRGARIRRELRVIRKDGTIEERVLDIDLGESTMDPKVVTAAHPTVGKVTEAVLSLLKTADGD